MSVILNPYLNFNGEAKEALEFYHTVFGGSLTTSTYAEGGMPHDPVEAGKIMHGQIIGDNGINLMAADIPAAMGDRSNGSQSLSGDDEQLLRGYCEKLSDGGAVDMPLTQAPWGDHFGQVTDRFGIPWMVNIAGQPAS